VQWFSLIFGAVLIAAAVFYFIVGFFPETNASQRLRARLELAAEIGRARPYRMNLAGLYAWLFQTRIRASFVVIFLLFWGVWFMTAFRRMT
jgi:Na+-translocating ferredoxin:NAD+ oxidoreductase RnfA subunit